MVNEKPDALLILGDTNSTLSAISVKRLKIPIFHMETGNRCFDENLPEEPENIEGHLPEHGINGILDQPREPGPKGIVVEMRDSKILFNDITDF